VKRARVEIFGRWIPCDFAKSVCELKINCNKNGSIQAARKVTGVDSELGHKLRSSRKTSIELIKSHQVT